MKVTFKLMLKARHALLSFLISTPAAVAAVSGPYPGDANTVHLFHFSETSGTSAANSGSNARPLLAFNGTAIPASNTASQPAPATPQLGATGFTGFGTCATITNVAYGLGLDANNSAGFQPGTTSNGAGNSNGPDALAQSSFASASGAFTVEALVNLASITGASREIVSTDSSATNRGFQFRINTSGQLEFNFIATAGSNVAFAIPTTGVHAFAANEWFHAAVAFDGATTTLYWTRLNSSVITANSLGSSTSESTSATVTGPLVIGNEARNASGEGLIGLIDEVRVSNIARSADQFIFVSNDTDGDGLDDAWEITHFTSISVQNGSGDPDADGFNNEAEETAGSNPTNSSSTPLDLDADGLADAWELTHFTSISAQDGSGDPDGDFATNEQEESSGTNPISGASWPDTDSDGMNDGWEMAYFSTLARDGSGNLDADSSTDKQEHDANSDPTNPLWSATTAQLSHRWSFNGNLTDSSGGSTATILDPDANTTTGGGATLSANDLLLGGGARGTSSYLQLGQGLIGGSKTPVSIELWATQQAVQNWSRILDIGSSTADDLLMSWSQGTTLASDRIEWVDSVTTTANNTCAPYVLGTKYHIVLVISPRAGASGTTLVTWYASPASSANLGAARGTFSTSNSLLNLADSVFWLGRSQWTADNTANARYDEVRIWKGALTATERESYHVFGPDVASNEDSDLDGLPDGWEIACFEDLLQTGTGDPDGDGYNNAAEYSAFSNPTNNSSVPGDIDGDTLADAWESIYFGNLLQTASGDPDGDGETNGTEQTNASAPNNRASSSTDMDADGLADAWEISNFGNLSSNAGADPDGDRFSNLQEQSAGTQPANASSRPPGTATKLVPVDDSNIATSEFGYAGPSAINSVSFARSSLHTVGNQQFLTYYGRHQYDSAAAFNNTIWIARRTLGASAWEVFRHPTFTANTITDGHDVIAFGIDGEGYMHLSWGMHGDAFHYSKSTTPVTGTGPITLGADTTMTGREATVTYPQFLTLPDGDLLYLFREGASGSGDTYLNRYDIATHTWDNVHRSGTTQLPFIKGTGWTPDYNAYPNMPQLGGDGDDLTLTWCWRYNGDSPAGQAGYQTNNNIAFAKSTNAGVTWQRSNGAAYTLPISRSGESGVSNTTAEHIVTIPEGSSLINQASTYLDANGNPVTATWWAPNTSSGNYRRQYMVTFKHDNGTWQTRPVSNRTIDPTGTKYSETFVRNLGRPIVVTDNADRIIVAYRDNQNTNGITLVHSLPKAQDPDRQLWIELDLTTDNLGNYEPIIDYELWARDRQLHFLYQQSEGEGYTPPANTAARMSVLEWDAAAYFANRPQPSISFSNDRTQVHILCPSEPSWSYRLWTSTDLISWTPLETRAGTGEPLDFIQTSNASEPKRFWRIESAEGGF